MTRLQKDSIAAATEISEKLSKADPSGYIATYYGDSGQLTIGLIRKGFQLRKDHISFGNKPLSPAEVIHQITQENLINS